MNTAHIIQTRRPDRTCYIKIALEFQFKKKKI